MFLSLLFFTHFFVRLSCCFVLLIWFDLRVACAIRMQCTTVDKEACTTMREQVSKDDLDLNLYRVTIVYISVPECLSLRRNWVLHPLPRKLVCLPPWTQRGEQHSLAGGGVGGGPNSDDWKENFALCILCALTLSIHQRALQPSLCSGLMNITTSFLYPVWWSRPLFGFSRPNPDENESSIANR